MLTSFDFIGLLHAPSGPACPLKNIVPKITNPGALFQVPGQSAPLTSSPGLFFFLKDLFASLESNRND
jgi:hypothetical protein